MKVNTTGISSMIFAWRGSPITGVIFCCTNIETPISEGQDVGRIVVGEITDPEILAAERQPRGRRPKQMNGAFWISTATDSAT